MRIMVDNLGLVDYDTHMAKRGRPTKSRTSELGQYIEELRRQHGWSLLRLASEASVSYKTLSKL